MEHSKYREIKGLGFIWSQSRSDLKSDGNICHYGKKDFSKKSSSPSRAYAWFSKSRLARAEHMLGFPKVVEHEHVPQARLENAQLGLELNRLWSGRARFSSHPRPCPLQSFVFSKFSNFRISKSNIFTPKCNFNFKTLNFLALGTLNNALVKKKRIRFQLKKLQGAGGFSCQGKSKPKS